MDVPAAFERVQRALLPTLDIVAGRIIDARVPAWCARRGWTDFLLALGQSDLERCEAEGLAWAIPTLSGVPQDLAELAAQLRAFSALPVVGAPSVALAREDYRGVSQRKREQLGSLLGALPPLADAARRIVDVGSGSGHFTRLAAHHFQRDALGLERRPERVDSATLRTHAQAQAHGDAAFKARFAVVDALTQPIALRADDLAIGLHACGELGDALVTAVAESGADLALVSCCLQKISTPERAWLSRAARGLPLQRDTLGLSNLLSRAIGVETGIERTMHARKTRHALRRLLEARGLRLPPGAEMRGINRRRALFGLPDLARQAFAQRQLAPPSPEELAEHARDSAVVFEQMRRLALPRNMLGRAIELSVVLDRAMRLHETGYAVRVATLFDHSVTPRNLALFASRDASRLPA